MKKVTRITIRHISEGSEVYSFSKAGFNLSGCEMIGRVLKNGRVVSFGIYDATHKGVCYDYA